MTRLLAALLLWLAFAAPAQAAVTVTFWSHEFGNDFPHAFFSLRGTPDRGGPAVDTNYGFTASAITPAILFGPVASRIDIAKPGYMRGSDAQFSLILTDRQYDELLQLVAEWGTPGFQYMMNSQNCVHFTAEAARRLGLAGTDQPKLMKKPRSYMQALMAANAGRVTVVAKDGKDYLDALPPLATAAVAPTPRILPPPVVRTIPSALASAPR
jgi:hypothetical protein